MECEFCNKQFSSKGYLQTHQQKTRYCLELQKKASESGNKNVPQTRDDSDDEAPTSTPTQTPTRIPPPTPQNPPAATTSDQSDDENESSGPPTDLVRISLKVLEKIEHDMKVVKIESMMKDIRLNELNKRVEMLASDKETLQASCNRYIEIIDVLSKRKLPEVHFNFGDKEKDKEILTPVA